MKKGKAKVNKIVFTPEIDSSINGFAVGLSFSLISAFVLWKSDYFGIPIVSYIIGAIMGVIGVMGCAIEMSRIIKVKGFGDFLAGSFCLILWCLLYFPFGYVITNVIAFLLMIAGAYGVILGILRIIYSLFLETKDKKGAFKSGVLLLAQILGLVLTILNILKIFGIFA